MFDHNLNTDMLHVFICVFLDHSADMLLLNVIQTRFIVLKTIFAPFQTIQKTVIATMQTCYRHSHDDCDTVLANTYLYKGAPKDFSGSCRFVVADSHHDCASHIGM